MADIYNSIAAKLNYELQTKQSIREAIINKGVEVPESTPFREYVNKIEAITTSGSFFGTLKTNETVWEGDDNFTMFSDVVLADEITKEDFYLSDNIDNVERIDNLNFKITLKEPAKYSDQITVQTKETAYLNKNGESIKYSKFISPPSWEDYQDETRHMIQLKTPGKQDSWNTGSISYEDVYGQKHTFSANSESQINIDEYAGNAFNISNRDDCIYSFWWTKCNHLDYPFIKFRWFGISPYNATAPNKEYELFAFDKGKHVYLHMFQHSSVLSGVSKVYDTKFTYSPDYKDISFYRKNFDSPEMEVIYDKFDFEYAKQRDADMVSSGTLDSFLGNYILDPISDIKEYPYYIQIANNKKFDGDIVKGASWNKNHYNIMPIYLKNPNDATKTTEMTSYTANGDFIFLANSSTAAYFKSYINTRDSAVYYFHIANRQLTDYNNLRATQFIYRGNSAYGGSGIDQEIELWFFKTDEDGLYPSDAMFYIKKLGTNKSNSHQFMGKKLDATKITDNSFVSFYWNKEEQTYDIVYDKYRLR